jgi:hypothetical protein
MSARRMAPQRFARPSGGPKSFAVTRQASSKRFAVSQQQRRKFVGSANRGGTTVRQALRQQAGQSARLARNPAAQQPKQSFQLAGAGNNRTLSGRTLRNQVVASKLAAAGSKGSALASAATFKGQFGDKHFKGHFADKQWSHFGDKKWWWHHHRGHITKVIVIGWIGPLFWPYAYYDFVDWTFYPVVYDVFWPYAYDDVYEGMFGQYAYGYSPAYAAVGRPPGSVRGRPGPVSADVCSGQTAGLTDWPIERIAQTVEPDATQRAALDELRAATARALDILKAACPTELASTPTGRLDAMHKRLEAMLQAVRIVRPALEGFHQSLNDEQKARFSALGPDDGQADRTRRDLAQACGERASGIGSLPIERIERAVRPIEAQRTALQELKDATSAAIDLLKSDCPTYRALTPVGRLEAMEQRLDAMLRAVQTVQPVLERFYGSLSAEQKERFNRLSPEQS